MLNKILAKQIYQHIKRIICHGQVVFILGMSEWFNIRKSINAIHHINRIQGQKEKHDHLDAEKSCEKNPTHSHDKNHSEN